MSAPTISTITPASGPTGGRSLVELTGTNFKLPPAPPTSGPAPAPEPSVKVEFRQVVVRHTPDGRALSSTITRPAIEVAVDSATHLVCLTPVGDHGENAAALAADVIVTNLDLAGVAVPGESATKLAAYSYHLPSLAAESDLARVCRALLQELKRQVCEETMLTVETDWDPDATDGLNHTGVAKVPSITLIGPDLAPSPDFATLDPEVERSAGDVFARREAVVPKDVTFILAAVTDAKLASVNLVQQLEEFFRRNPYLELDRIAGQPTQGTVQFELALDGDLKTTGALNLSNLRTFSGTVIIRGVPVSGLPGVVDDTVFDRGQTVETIEFGLEQLAEVA